MKASPDYVPSFTRCSQAFRVVFILTFVLFSFSLQAQVKEEWTQRFNYMADSGEESNPLLTTDPNGAVYVTAVTDAGSSCADIITVKYDKSGGLIWERRFKSPGNSCAMPQAIVTEIPGFVLIAAVMTDPVDGANPLLRPRQRAVVLKYNKEGNLQYQSPYYDLVYNEQNKVSLGLKDNNAIYLTGSSGDGRIFINKYDPSLELLWSKQYQDPQKGTYIYGGMVLDTNHKQENIYIGASARRASGEAFVGLKFDNAGTQLWRSEYKLANSRNMPVAFGLDHFSNFFMTGTTFHLGRQQSDMLTMKFSAQNGKRIWVQAFNGAGKGNDLARDLVINNADGSVAVLGTSVGQELDTDLVTVKYDSSGVEKWTNYYDKDHQSEFAGNIAKDPDGNIFITGSYDQEGFVTLKYTPLGALHSMQQYKGQARLAALTSLPTGEMVVAGIVWKKGGGLDMLTIKIKPNNSNKWESRHNVQGRVNGIEQLEDMAVTSAGEVFLTGQSNGSFTTLKYHRDGSLLWLNRSPHKDSRPRAITLDPDQQAVVSGYGKSMYDNFSDFKTVKYKDKGEESWAKSFGEPAYFEKAEAVLTDAAGNVYVTGASEPSALDGEADILTIKYDVNGMLQWISRYSGTGSGPTNDRPMAMVIDTSGNVLVTGQSGNAAGGLDYVTIKYNSNGKQLWAQRYNGPGNGDDIPAALVLDAAGNIFVTGSSGGGANDLDVATVKYTADGKLVWDQRYNGPGNGRDEGKDLNVAYDGSVYVTGGSQATDGFLDYVTLKYSKTGEELWARHYNGPAGSNDIAMVLTLDVFGKALVTGSSAGIGTGNDYATLKYDPRGNLLWEQRYNGPVNGQDDAGYLSVDGKNDVYVAGTSIGLENTPDVLLIKYTQTSTTVWTGDLSTDWHTAGNWTNGVPTYETDALIPANLSRYPVLESGTAMARDLAIAGRMSITAGQLNLKGDLINTGSLTSTGGQVSFSGTLEQLIAGYGQTIFMDLSVGESNLSLAGPIQVKGILQLDGNLITHAHQLLLVSEEAGTAMVVNSGGEVLGAATMQRYITPKKTNQGYRHFSSPVTNSIVADLATPNFTPLVNPYWNVLPTPYVKVDEFPTVQKYDESRLSSDYNYFNAGWKSPETLLDPLLPGHGYAVNLPVSALVDFVGTLNNGDISVPLTRGPVSGSGWNFLGNPYPAPIDWDYVKLPEGVNNAVYVFQPTGKYAGTYISYVNGVGSLPGGVIGAMQGFLIRAAKNTTFTFTNEARLTTYANPAFYKKEQESRPLVELQVESADGKADQAFVYFQNGASRQPDLAFDAPKPEGNLPGQPLIYSLAGSEKLAINGLPLPTEEVLAVPLAVKTSQPGSHTLHAAQVLNFPADLQVFLADKLTGTMQHLQSKPDYSFTATAQDQERFTLYFRKGLETQITEQNQQAGVMVYPNPVQDQQLHISMGTVAAPTVTATLFSALGQVVLQQSLAADNGRLDTTLALPLLPKGVYILQLNDGKTLSRTRLSVK